jgi:hypothetical protein
MRTVRASATACAIFLAALSNAGAQPLFGSTGSGTFTPQSGQAGKDVIWIPSPQALVDRMLYMAGATPADYLIDLGSGDGRTVITAAQRGIKALGVEYNPQMVELSRAAAAAAGVADKARFVHGDIFETDFSQADVLTLFLLDTLNVVSNTFKMGDWTPDQTIEAGGDCTSYCTAHKWTVPAKVGGTWRLPDGELTLTQRYQMVTGTVSAQGTQTPITEGRLNGAELSFVAGGKRFKGIVRGTRIEATGPDGTQQIWVGVLNDG